MRDSGVESVTSFHQLVTKVVPCDAVLNLLERSVARANLIGRQLTCVRVRVSEYVSVCVSELMCTCVSERAIP